MYEPKAYITLPEFDAPFIAYSPATDAYYLRFNDPPEFLDIPGYRGDWQNLDAMERDRPIHVINTPGCNGQNLDYAPDWYPTPQQAIDFKESTDEEKAMIFGIKGGVPDTALTLLPGDLILRDQRWFGTFSGNAGERFIDITLDLEASNGPEISDKFITTFSSQPIDTSFVTAVYGTHIEVTLLAYEPGYIAFINGESHTIFSYDRGKLYLIGGTSGIVVGQTVQIYVERTYVPMNDNDFDAFQSGSAFHVEGFSTAILDHFPNARSIVQSIEGDLMCDLTGSTPHYKSMSSHPQGEEFYYSRFLPECWAKCDLPTTQIYLRQPLTQDFVDQPFAIINKQWYVASVEALAEIPEGHEPECWAVLRIGGSDIPYRFRRCLFKNWNTDDLAGDITYSYGKINPPMIHEDWFEEHDGNLYNGFPNWYQSLEPRRFNYDGVKIDGYIPPGEWTSHGLVLECTGEYILFDREISDSPIVEWKQWATLTRILTVPNLDFYNSLGNFVDMFVCNLQGDPYFRNLPQVTPEGLVWTPWSRQLYAGKLAYVTGEEQ